MFQHPLDLLESALWSWHSLVWTIIVLLLTILAVPGVLDRSWPARRGISYIIFCSPVRFEAADPYHSWALAYNLTAHPFLLAVFVNNSATWPLWQKKCHCNARKFTANSWVMSVLSLSPNSISISGFLISLVDTPDYVFWFKAWKLLKWQGVFVI